MPLAVLHMFAEQKRMYQCRCSRHCRRELLSSVLILSLIKVGDAMEETNQVREQSMCQHFLEQGYGEGKILACDSYNDLMAFKWT